MNNEKHELDKEAYSHERSDCTVVALTKVSDYSYSECYKAWSEVGRKKSCGVSCKKKLRKVCKVLNLNFKQVKRHGTVQSFINTFPTGNYFCTKRKHAFAIINGKISDSTLAGSYLKGAWLITQKE
jgi:hypothetical protein